jgi:hypothetical protein
VSARAPRPSLNDSEEEDFREAGPEGNGSNSPFPGDREWTEHSLLDSSAEWEDRAAVARAVCSAPPGARLRPRAGRAALNRRGLAADGARDRVQDAAAWVAEDAWLLPALATVPAAPILALYKLAAARVMLCKSIVMLCKAS